MARSANLNETLSFLRRRGIVENRLQVITDFFTGLLKHAGHELQREGLGHEYPGEIVLCVPPIWSQRLSFPFLAIVIAVDCYLSLYTGFVNPVCGLVRSQAFLSTGVMEASLHVRSTSLTADTSPWLPPLSLSSMTIQVGACVRAC
ncbi:unnamed protein product [Fusarium graminearum]|nr:unnamed protein product [Fusarium graminearum]